MRLLLLMLFIVCTVIFPHLPHVKWTPALIQQPPVSALYIVFNPFVTLTGAELEVNV